MTEVLRKPRGPKPKAPEDVKRNSFTFRLHEIMRTKLLASATRHGRSMSEEVEHRLAISLDDDERFGDAESQMFGRTVGATIMFENKLLLERKRQAGDDLKHAEWWRDDAGRSHVLEKIIDAIEGKLGKSRRWMMPPEQMAKRVNDWISATPETQFKPSLPEAVLQLIEAGMRADPPRKLHWYD